jgi:hypothetical protein
MASGKVAPRAILEVSNERFADARARPSHSDLQGDKYTGSRKIRPPESATSTIKFATSTPQ